MTNITAALVKALRDKTGAGMMDCKRALTETDGARVRTYSARVQDSRVLVDIT